jgi:hypothetical protein
MNDWYFAKNGQQNGPVTLEQLRELVRSGGLDAKDLVWNTSMKDWTPAGQVESLFSVPPATPVPAADPSNPYAAPQSTWTEPAAALGTALAEIVPGSEPLDPVACVKRGFHLTTRHFGTILLVGVTFIVVSTAMSFLLGAMDQALGLVPVRNSQWEMRNGFYVNAFENDGSWLNILIAQVFDIFLSLGVARIGLNLVSGAEVSVGMLFGEGRKLLRAIVASLLYGLMVGVGLLLLIVPGIYLALRYGQYMNAIVDRDLGILDSLNYSSSITTGNRMNLFVLALLSIAIFVAGVLALVVGLIFAFPVIWLAWIVAYRWMQYGHRSTMDDPATGAPLLASR